MHASHDSLLRSKNVASLDYRLAVFLSQAIKLPCLALLKALIASSNFWKKLMIEDKGKKVVEGS